MVEIRNISFSYGSKPVLRDVSFVASPGEVVCIVGANGAGKTTLLKILSNLVIPDGGVIMCDGQDALSRPLRYRRQIGYLPESPALYPDMTVRDYLTYRAELKGEPMRRVRRRIGEAVEFCGIGEVLKSRIAPLSLGMRKRVALADALLLRPRILLLDDFLSGMDLPMRDSAGEILSSSAAFSSVIVTGHDIDDFLRWATRILVLKDGVIACSVTASGSDVNVLRNRLAEALRGGQR